MDPYWTIISGVLSCGAGPMLALPQLVDEPASTVHAGGNAAIEPSRTQLWLVSGWGFPDQHPARASENRHTQIWRASGHQP